MIDALLSDGVRVVAVGPQRFAEALAEAGVPAVHVAWQPPATTDATMASLLAKLQS